MIEFVRKDRVWYMFIDGEYIEVAHIHSLAKDYFKYDGYDIKISVKTNPNNFNHRRLEAKKIKRENDEYIQRKSEGLIK